MNGVTKEKEQVPTIETKDLFDQQNRRLTLDGLCTRNLDTYTYKLNILKYNKMNYSQNTNTTNL